ncbi:uncharacterized protein BXZ73DRAFT_76522 [Epithele typhae]|uniref:uncharacterized protein n=1 Tax=Epithele typhae TaxID=378194 RepID=UPI0020086EB8|nr:uncharacterized protein BXZ73DRAFT_76522 [Epithele typhae]KAH9937894.1 hypothetical protein BXZ73DRAFT_76522 [Epithele typhae]
METLPVELLQRICFFAAFDGSAMSCSLALVSKHIHRVSQYHRFDNVALMGRPGYIEALTRRLEAGKTRNAASSARLRHLFLICTQSQYLQLVEKGRRSSTGRSPFMGKISFMNGGPVYLPEGFLSPNGANDTTPDSVLRYAKSINDLLRAAGPGLETLTIVFLERDLTQHIRLPLTLPTLRELTISGAPPSWLLDIAEPRPPHQPPRFLALRRLHWYERSGPEGTLRDIPAVAARLPALTHFRLTGYMDDSMPGVFDACADEDVLERIADSLEPENCRTYPHRNWWGLPPLTLHRLLDPPKVPLLPEWCGLQQFAIQPPSVRCRDEQGYGKEIISKLRLMLVSLASASLPVHVFEAGDTWQDEDGNQAMSVDMLRYWHEERIRGNRGCWADTEHSRRTAWDKVETHLNTSSRVTFDPGDVIEAINLMRLINTSETSADSLHRFADVAVAFFYYFVAADGKPYILRNGRPRADGTVPGGAQ